jgi:hypothetical protein
VGTATALTTPAAWHRGSGEGRPERQAERTFFVAMVARAAITTSSSSFFMAAIVAVPAAAFDAIS